VVRRSEHTTRTQSPEATLEKRAAQTKAKKASRRSDAPKTDDSPKRQGDKLEHAHDAATGSDKRK
jgi:hypothetical protein